MDRLEKEAQAMLTGTAKARQDSQANFRAGLKPDLTQQGQAAPAGNNAAPQGALTGGPPPTPDAKLAPDGNWYVPDPARPGKYLRVDR
jgi:hypothetical protein